MLNERIIEESHQEHIKQDIKNNGIILRFEQHANAVPSWGNEWQRRDKYLREFWLTEDILQSSIYNIAETRATLGYTLKGTPKGVAAANKLLRNSEFGMSWYTLVKKTIIDILTQDNGAFIEIIRKKNSPKSPAIGLAHLDAAKCERTGNAITPVIYNNGKRKIALKWWEVIMLEDMPHPNSEYKGRQVCFLSRVLNMARTVYEIQTYNEEKISGRFAKQIHMVSGIPSKELDKARELAEHNADNLGLNSYMPSIILTSVDPSAKLSHVQLDLASMPTGFKYNETMEWYITLLAMAAGGEYQDFSPLPGGGLGSSEQSKTLHLKAQSKGNAGFMKLMEHKLVFHNVIPNTVSFSYLQQDVNAEQLEADLKDKIVTTVVNLLNSKIIDEGTARQMLVSDGVLDPTALINDSDTVTAIAISDDEMPKVVEKSIKDSPVPFKLRIAVGKYLKELIQLSPLENRLPTHHAQLDTFCQTIIRESKYPAVIEFSATKRLHPLLRKACQESGLSITHILSRLPDNYTLSILPNIVKDSLGERIEAVQELQKPVLRKKSVGAVFTLTSGWTDSGIGIDAEDGFEPSIQELVDQVKSKILDLGLLGDNQSIINVAMSGYKYVSEILMEKPLDKNDTSSYLEKINKGISMFPPNTLSGMISNYLFFEYLDYISD